jgi:hypothetical protein
MWDTLPQHLDGKFCILFYSFGTIQQEEYDTFQLTHAVVLISVVVAVRLAITVPQEWYAAA